MFFNQASYAPVAQEDDPSPNNVVYVSQVNYDAHPKRLSIWLTSIIALCTLVDVVLLSHLAISQIPTSTSPQSLQILNSYINFDILYQNHSSAPRRPFANLGIRPFSHISSAEPDRVFPQWRDSWMTPSGSIPRNVLRLWVTPTISTVTQFRAIDYGMENCTLALTIPPRDHIPAGFIFSDFQEDRVTLDVWSLRYNAGLNVRELSWNTRAKRVAYMGSFAASYGSTHELPGFPCPSGSYQTFEISCSVPNCGIDVTNSRGQAMGLYLKQYQTG